MHFYWDLLNLIVCDLVKEFLLYIHAIQTDIAIEHANPLPKSIASPPGNNTVALVHVTNIHFWLTYFPATWVGTDSLCYYCLYVLHVTFEVPHTNCIPMVV